MPGLVYAVSLHIVPSHLQTSPTQKKNKKEERTSSARSANCFVFLFVIFFCHKKNSFSGTPALASNKRVPASTCVPLCGFFAFGTAAAAFDRDPVFFCCSRGLFGKKSCTVEAQPPCRVVSSPRTENRLRGSRETSVARAVLGC